MEPLLNTSGSDLEKDEVDEIQQGWRRELPEVDFTQKGIALRVLALAANLEEAAQRACAESGLDLSLYKILSELRRAAPQYELKPRDLVRCLPISSGGLTSLIDRAELSGLVRRRPDPHDRRGVVVSITPKGQKAVEAAVRRRAEVWDRVLAPLGAEDRKTLEQLLKRLLAQFQSPRLAGRAAPEAFE